MASCFSFNLVQYRVNRLRAFYRSKGLTSRLITLENGCTIHCWVPDEESESKRAARPPRGHASVEEQDPIRPPERPPPHGPPPPPLPEMAAHMMRPDDRRRRTWRDRVRVPPNGFLRAQSLRWRTPGGGSLSRGSRPRRSWSSSSAGPEFRAPKPPPPHPRAARPALLLIHGFGGDGTLAWENQVGAFAKDYRVFVPDLLFFGTSRTSGRERSEIFQADCLKDMLEHLHVQETHVVGTSYGGFVAFWMAHKFPRLCRKVVLASSGICMNPRSNDSLLQEYNLSTIDEILLPTTVDGLKLAFSVIFAKPPGLPDFIVQQILDIFYPRDDRQHRLELLNSLVIGSEKCPALPALTQEVLIVWGRRDQVFKLPLASQLQKHLGEKRTQMVIIEGAGHMPQQEKFKHFNAAVSDFLSDSDLSQFDGPP